jgi:hypothetical protein
VDNGIGVAMGASLPEPSQAILAGGKFRLAPGSPTISAFQIRTSALTVSSLAPNSRSQRAIRDRAVIQLAVITGAAQEHSSHRETVSQPKFQRASAICGVTTLHTFDDIRRGGGSVVIVMELTQEFPLHFHDIGLPAFGR